MGGFSYRWKLGFEGWLYRVYYSLPGISYGNKRKFVQYVHRRFSWITSGTISYAMNQLTANENNGGENLWNSVAVRERLDYGLWRKLYEHLSLFEKLENLFVQSRLREEMAIFIFPGGSRKAIEYTLESIRSSMFYGVTEPWLPDLRLLEKEVSRGRWKWVVLIKPGVRITECGLFYIGRTILDYPDGDLFYGDEDYLDGDHKRIHPYFKPSWNPEMSLSHDFLGTVLVIRSSVLQSVLSQIPLSLYDLGLKASDIATTNGVVHVPHIVASRQLPDIKETLDIQLGVVSALERRRGDAGVFAEDNGTVRLRYRSSQDFEKVSILIPTRDGLRYLKKCIDSILRYTTYLNYEIIVIDNGSTDPPTLAYLDKLATRNNPHPVQVIRVDTPFNYSHLNNLGTEYSTGEMLCLMNNDIEVLGGDWLNEMTSHARRPGIGAVGARLLYPDGSIQHAGVIIGLGGAAGHLLRSWDPGKPDHLGPYGVGRNELLQEVSAVTAACLVVRKDRYIEVGGLDEEVFSVTYNDVDFCLRLRERGYRNLYTPFSTLIHHESVSRGDDSIDPVKAKRYMQELKALQARWHTQHYMDPAYNPNLCAYGETGVYSFPPRN